MIDFQRINPSIIRSYDVRGVVGRDLGISDARALGAAYATVARERGLFRIAVARDGRLSSQALERALVEGLVAGGMHVQRIGLGPTPQLYFAVHAFQLDGGIMVTGSHNPPDENGFKLLLGTEPVFGAVLQSLAAARPRAAAGGSVSDQSVAEAYVERLAQIGADIAPLTVAWDCGNGATGATLERLVERLPGKHLLLNTRIDGRFPAHHPDPTVPANLRELQATVLERGCDLGIAFDGDGDRIGIVDGTGAILWPDQLLLLLAAEVLRRRPGATIIGDVKSSRVLFDGIAALGGRPVMAPSGYVLIRAAMLREQSPLAGEMSGHIFYADDWYGTDDGLHVAMRVLCAISRTGRSLEAFRKSLPQTVTTPELRIPCPDGRKSAVIREVASRLKASGVQVDMIDGVRVATTDGWWLLRASGTESKLTARCEAASRQSLAAVLETLAEQLAASGVDPQIVIEALPERTSGPA